MTCQLYSWSGIPGSSRMVNYQLNVNIYSGHVLNFFNFFSIQIHKIIIVIVWCHSLAKMHIRLVSFHKYFVSSFANYWLIMNMWIMNFKFWPCGNFFSLKIHNVFVMSYSLCQIVWLKCTSAGDIEFSFTRMNVCLYYLRPS